MPAFGWVCADLRAMACRLVQLTGNPIFDGVATICISGLLAAVSLKLVQLNRSFIVGRVGPVCVCAG